MKTSRYLAHHLALRLHATLIAIIAVFAVSTELQAADLPLRTHQRIDADWRFEMLGDQSKLMPAGPELTNWRWTLDDQAQTDSATMAGTTLDTTGPAWHNAVIGADVFGGKPGDAWFRAIIMQPQAPVSIHFESVDDVGTVYLNGKLLGHHSGWSDAFDVDVRSAWNPQGPNVLAVLIHNQDGAGGLGGKVILATGDTAMPAEATASFDASSWKVVHLPHDFVVGGTFDQRASANRGFLPSGAGWYRKTLDLPASTKGKRIWLDFDGVYRDSQVWVNSHFLERHPCGYTGFRYDISDVAHYGGTNEIAVLADARQPEGWWYEGGGIYRHVWLNINDPVSIAPDGVYVTSAVNGLAAGQSPSASLSISTTLSNATSHAASATLASTAIRPDGTTAGTVTSSVSIPSMGTVDVAQAIADATPLLWSLETPRLYRLRTVVSISGKPTDSLDTPFGVRSIRFDADKGFLLNEKPVKIKGTCNHQDFAGIGVALPDGILSWRVKKLKEMGSNAYRTSHNEVASELLDACDTQGMLVMDETRHFGDGEAGKASEETPAVELSNLRQQVMRDRNHPSIIMWSIGNEEGVQGSPAGLRIGTAMKALINKLDSSRPVTEAINSGHSSGSSTILDLEGFNYWPEGYNWYHGLHPGEPELGSETASALSTRGVYTTAEFNGAGVTQHGDQSSGWVAAYDVNRPSWGQTAEDAWKPINERSYVAGGFVWTGFDYRGEPTPFGWPCVNSAFGIMDMCGFPKDSYYYYQSVWGDKPMVHVLPHWNWAGREGQPIDVWAYSNAERVELFLNGASLGSQDVPKDGHVSWQVPYAPGKLTATAMTGGKVVATDAVATTGAPAAIRLTTDRPAVIADGEDESPVCAAIVDAEGRVVPTAGNVVTFSLSGPGSVAGVGNGDPSSHEPDIATQRSAFNGLCMAVVKAGEGPGGMLTVTATAEGLTSASIKLTATK